MKRKATQTNYTSGMASREIIINNITTEHNHFNTNYIKIMFLGHKVMIIETISIFNCQ